MLFLEQLFVFIAQVHHRRHVHLVKGGQHRGGILRLFQTARDGLAQARHLHAFFALALRQSSAARGRLRNIFFHDPAIAARSLNLIARQPGFGHRLFRRGCILNIPARRPVRRRSSGCGGLCARRGGSGSCGSGCSSGRTCRPTCAFFDHAEQAVFFDGRAIGGDDFAHRARYRRWHFNRHLIGFQLAEHLIDFDRIAGFLEPRRHSRFGYRFAQRGYAHFRRHDVVPLVRAKRPA